MNTLTERTNKPNQSVANADIVARHKSDSQAAFELADNRPEAIRQMRLRNVIQNSPRVTSFYVQSFTIVKPSGKVLQRATVSWVQGRENEGVLRELQNMMGAVGEGNATGGNEVALGVRVRRAPSPRSQQQTYALGENTERALLAVGSEAFRAAVGAGRRIGRGLYHAEMKAVEQEYTRAIYATQNCCIFCYGYLEANDIAHQALRENPWPNTGWRHPGDRFRLSAGRAALGNVIRVTHDGDSRYFQLYLI